MAARSGINVLRKLARASRPPTPVASSLLCRLRPYPGLPRTLQPAQLSRRHAHSIPKPPTPTDPATGEAKTRKQLEPHYELTFTCVPCSERSTHTISKQGYHHGSVLITCPSCRNRHVISDHMNIFGDRNITVEDLMRERGQLVKRGTLGEDGDVEFWEDGTTTERGNGSRNSAAARDLKAPSGADQASASHEARNPSAQAAAQSHTSAGASSPLGGHGNRPRVDAHTSTTPSTRRQMSNSRPTRMRTAGMLDFRQNDNVLLRSETRRLVGIKPPSRVDYESWDLTSQSTTVRRGASNKRGDRTTPAMPRRVKSNAPSWFLKARRREDEEYRSMATKTAKMPRDMLIRGKVSLAWDRPPVPRPSWDASFNLFRKVGADLSPASTHPQLYSKHQDPNPPNPEEPLSPSLEAGKAKPSQECLTRREKQPTQEAKRQVKEQARRTKKEARQARNEARQAGKEASRQARRDRGATRKMTDSAGGAEPQQGVQTADFNRPRPEETEGTDTSHSSTGLRALEAVAVAKEGRSWVDSRRQQQRPRERVQGTKKQARRPLPVNQHGDSRVITSSVYAWPKGATKPIRIVSRKAPRKAPRTTLKARL